MGGTWDAPQRPGEPQPRPETRTGWGEGAHEWPPREAAAAALCRTESRTEAAGCLSVEEVLVCPQKPLDSRGQARSLGRDDFCFTVQIRVQVSKPPTQPSEMKTLEIDLTKRKKSMLSKTTMECSSARETPETLLQSARVWAPAEQDILRAKHFSHAEVQGCFHAGTQFASCFQGLTFNPPVKLGACVTPKHAWGSSD